MSLGENKVIIRTFLIQSNSEGRTLAELCAPGVTFHIGAAPAMALQAFEHFQTTYYAAFPDSRITIEDLVAEGDRVAFRGVVRATHSAEFMGVPASGREIAVPTIGIAKLADGRIAEW